MYAQTVQEPAKAKARAKADARTTLDLKTEAYLTIDEAAKYLRVSRRHVYRQIRRRRVQLCKFGRRSLLDREALDELVRQDPHPPKIAR
jgi:excisionase family DNA binding protein